MSSQSVLSMFFAPDTSPRAEEMRRRMAEIAAEEQRLQAIAARAAEDRELAEIAAEQAHLDAARAARTAARDAQAAAARDKRREDLQRRRVGHALVAPGVYLGNEYASTDAAFFAAAGVAAVVNCTRDLPCVFEADGVRTGPGTRRAVAYCRVPVDDSADAAPALGAHLAAACAFVADARARGDAVLVHCREGRSRSAAVCAAYLMRTERVPLRTAVARLDDAAWTTAINTGFLRVLMDEEAALFGPGSTSSDSSEGGEGSGSGVVLAGDRSTRESRPDMRMLHPELDERELSALCSRSGGDSTGDGEKPQPQGVREPTQPLTVDGKVYAIFARAVPPEDKKEDKDQEDKEERMEDVPAGTPQTAPAATGKGRKAKGSGTLPRGQQSIDRFFM